MSNPAPRSLRWRLPLIAALIVVAGLLAWVPGLWPGLTVGHRDTLLGVAAGAASAFALLLLVLVVPAARHTYFALLEIREQSARRDRRIGWLMGAAMALYLFTLMLARWAVPLAASPVAAIGLGLLPLLAMALYTTAMLLSLRQLDELMRKIELESWALAALVVSQGYFAAWVLLKAGLVHIDAGNALLWLGVWLLLVRTGVYVWLMWRYL